MRVRTSWTIRKPVASVWELLCNSKMHMSPSCPIYAIGAPTPVECRLPDGAGSPGAPRQCVSTHGIINQEIIEWVPPTKLSFRMDQTDMRFHECVSHLQDTFDLRSKTEQTTRVTRTTKLSLRAVRGWLSAPLIWLSLKSIHRYVFQNWANS